MKKFLIIFCLAILLVTNIPTMISVDGNRDIIYVDDDGGADYTSIQDAIDDANNGDKIIVKNGTYHEQLHIYKNIELSSQFGPKNTILTYFPNYAPSIDYIIKVTVHRVIINGFCLQNITTNWDYAIWLKNPEYCIITNNTIKNCHHSFLLEDSCFNYIANNTISTTHLAIRLDCSSYNTFTNNTIKHFGEGYSGKGFYFYRHSHHNNINRNYVNNFNTGVYFNGIYKSNNNRFFLNDFKNNKINCVNNMNNNIWNSTKEFNYRYFGKEYKSKMGNFWHDTYSGLDFDGDGIGDSSHGADNYPLIDSLEYYEIIYNSELSKYDVNKDGTINFQDAGLTWVHRTTQFPYDPLYDMNNDGTVNFQDAGIVWIHRD